MIRNEGREVRGNKRRGSREVSGNVWRRSRSEGMESRGIKRK